MTFATKAASILGYRVLPTTILAVISYLVVFLALGLTDKLPNVPKPNKQGGLDVEEAFEDLQHITAHPHSFNSHANDKARSYILSRLNTVALNYSHVHIVDDLVSNASFATAAGVYFEGTNILVKIDGTAGSDEGAVLFSAHYDSVATAPGVTDDGMGVVTLMQLVKYFAENRVPRTAVFNVNNGEEDGLYGAHVFLEHPWSKLTDTFLNLEGAAAGGRPVLFRATSTSPVHAVRGTKRVPHPHANVITSDAFARGFIRSGTDYSVYAGPGSRGGMAGLDLAFYKGRSRYHTKYDSVPYTLGGKKSLWSMMETSRGIGIGLLSAPFEQGKQTARGAIDDDPVYFDLFKSVLIVFRLKALLTINVVLLVVGPILLILLVTFERLFLRRKDIGNVIREDTSVISPVASAAPLNRSDSAQFPGADPDLRSEHPVEVNGRRHKFRAIDWVYVVWRHAKFWVALAVVIGFQMLLMWGYVVINPFAVYSSPYIIFFSFLALAYLSLVFTLTLPTSLPFYHPKGLPSANHFLLRPAQQQKHTLFFHFYAFTWILLVLGTLGITRVTPGIGGGYLLSAWNALLAVSCVLCIVEGLLTSTAWRKDEGYAELEGEGELPHRSHRHVEDADENTPLIWRQESDRTRRAGASAHPTHGHDDEEVAGGGSLATWWWIPQFLVSVPVPVILWGQVGMLLLDAMPQTLADGASPWNVYILTALPAVLIIIPLAPFAYKLRPYRPLSIAVFVVFLLTTLYAWLSFPFSIETPLKVYFQQRVEFPAQYIIAGPLPAMYTPKVITALIGPSKYIRDHIVPFLPSSQEGGKLMTCKPEKVRLGLLACEWESGARMMPSPGTGGEEFFKASVERTGPTSAQIRVKGQNTRSCRVYFDNQPVSDFAVWPSRIGHAERGVAVEGTAATGSNGMQEGYPIGPKGSNEIRLWSRTWDREFGIDVDWSTFANSTSDSRVRGRVSCNWSEFKSGTLDNGSLRPNAMGTQSMGTQSRMTDVGGTLSTTESGSIPAYEEALTFLPDWATPTKYTDGMVEAWAPFVI